jgi:hypothetical protein
MVPVEPTEAMLNACPASFSQSFAAIWPKICGDIYRAMLAAAPSVQPDEKTREAVARVRKQLNDLTRPFDNVVACEAADLRALLAALTVQKEEG